GLHADGTPRAVRKFGVYDDDLEVFEWLRADHTDDARCLEAQLMDVADDVAYSVHDLEDGVVAGRIDPTVLHDPAERREVWATVRDWYLPGVEDAELDDVSERLLASEAWPRTPYDGTRPAQAALKNLTSHLIGMFCTQVRDATVEAFGNPDARPFTRYAADLVVPRRTELTIAALKGVAAHYVMRADDRVAVLD